MLDTVYRLKISIHETKPPIWRRVLVPSSTTLAELHEVIQAAFGWYNCHLHGFEISDERYGITEGEHFGDPPTDERSTKLSDVAVEGDKFVYVYDFGDYWQHKIVVEKVEAAQPATTYPVLVTGRRACPPEDCGGPWGFYDFLAAVSDPEHEEHDTMLDWVGGEFDPADADLDGFQARLRAHARVLA